MKIDYTFVVVNLLELPLDVDRYILNTDSELAATAKPAMRPLVELIRNTCKFIKKDIVRGEFAEETEFHKDPQYRHLCVNYAHRLVCLLGHKATTELLAKVYYVPTMQTEVARLKHTVKDMMELQALMIEKGVTDHLALLSYLYERYQELIDGEYTVFDVIRLEVVVNSVVNIFAMTAEQSGLGKLIFAKGGKSWVAVDDPRPSRWDDMMIKLGYIRKNNIGIDDVL